VVDGSDERGSACEGEGERVVDDEVVVDELLSSSPSASSSFAAMNDSIDSNFPLLFAVPLTEPRALAVLSG